PGIFFSICFTFSAYEVIFEQQKFTHALQRSYALISRNFWPIVLRLFIIFIIVQLFSYGIKTPFEYLIKAKLGENMSWIANLILLPFSLLLTWFDTSYHLAIYKQVKER